MHLEQIRETVEIPQGANVSVKGSSVHAKGPKGEIERVLGNSRVVVSVESGNVVFTSNNATRREKRVLRTGKAHLKNMLRGVTEGHTYRLKICSGHFPMSVALKGDTLEVKNFIGEKVPRTLKIKQGCKVALSGQEITVEASSKELAGNQAASIELLTRRPGFDTRIFQDGIYIVEKDGKKV
jgi:large subunit ribosomal protein L6